MFGHDLSGLYVAFEGIRCCGKSTQARLLAEKLQREFSGREIILTKEPGGTEKSDEIRQVIISHSKERLAPWAEVLLFAASRAQSIAELTRPALERGAIVISDRCILSSLCYQGFGLDLGWQNVLFKNREALGGVAPDLIVFPDISVALSEERLTRRERRDNVYDTRDREFYERVRKGYLFFASKIPREILMVDGTLSSEAQAELVLRRIQNIVEGREAKLRTKERA